MVFVEEIHQNVCVEIMQQHEYVVYILNQQTNLWTKVLKIVVGKRGDSRKLFICLLTVVLEPKVCNGHIVESLFRKSVLK